MPAPGRSLASCAGSARLQVEIARSAAEASARAEPEVAGDVGLSAPGPLATARGQAPSRRRCGQCGAGAGVAPCTAVTGRDTTDENEVH